VISGLTDALTGLHNRRYLERRLDEEIARARRYGHPLSCLFIDADHFKRVNDLYGHAAGDQALREISLRVKECLRASDVATRFGGEEFALLLPQTGAREAFSLAERIRKRVLAHPIPLDRGDSLNISVSIGVSELDPKLAEKPGQKLISDADRALMERAVQLVEPLLNRWRSQETQINAFLSIARAIASAVDARDPHMVGHGERVCEFAQCSLVMALELVCVGARRLIIDLARFMALSLGRERGGDCVLVSGDSRAYRGSEAGPRTRSFPGCPFVGVLA